MILFDLLRDLLCMLTQPQPRQATHVPPGQGRQRAPVLHLGKVENERHAGDEDEVEDAHGGEEVGHLSEVGAAQEHLQQHLCGENSHALCKTAVCAGSGGLVLTL